MARTLEQRGLRQFSMRVLAPLILGCGILATGTIQPGQASDRILLSYGPLQLPISLDSLEAYARSGTLAPELAPYLQRFKPEIQAQLRASLSAQLQLSPEQLRQFLHSPLGERMLSGVSALALQPEVLRQAIIRAAEAESGLSLLGVLRQFPEAAQIDLKKLSQLWQRYETAHQQTQVLLQTLESDSRGQKPDRALRRSPRSKTDPSTHPGPYPGIHTALSFDPSTDDPSTELPDLRQPGPLRFELRSLQLRDDERDRTLAVDLYFPKDPAQDPAQDQPEDQPEDQPGSKLLGKARTGWESRRSLVIISHGLGADRKGHAFFARHLASHGIAAAVLQHPGSDSHQVQAMLRGQAREALEVSAFIDRPRDVSFVLDELERRNATEFDGQLRLDRVGLYGHSLGAYTALTLAGAKLNFARLKNDCQPEAYLLNLSMVLQCQALELPQHDYPLRDDRIAALMLFDPVSSSILDLSPVELPVFWGGSSADVVTPLAAEQLPAFEQLGSHRKYLSLLDGVQHINFKLDRLAEARGLDDAQLIQPKPQAFQDSVNALGLAFVQVYLSEDREYGAYLDRSYAQRLSQAPHTLRFLPPLTAD